MGGFGSLANLVLGEMPGTPGAASLSMASFRPDAAGGGSHYHPPYHPLTHGSVAAHLPGRAATPPWASSDPTEHLLQGQERGQHQGHRRSHSMDGGDPLSSAAAVASASRPGSTRRDTASPKSTLEPLPHAQHLQQQQQHGVGHGRPPAHPALGPTPPRSPAGGDGSGRAMTPPYSMAQGAVGRPPPPPLPRSRQPRPPLSASSSGSGNNGARRGRFAPGSLGASGSGSLSGGSEGGGGGGGGTGRSGSGSAASSSSYAGSYLPGDRCLAVFSEDGEWYEAEVSAVTPRGGTTWVVFTDFPEDGEHEAKEMKPLARKAQQQQQQQQQQRGGGGATSQRQAPRVPYTVGDAVMALYEEEEESESAWYRAEVTAIDAAAGKVEVVYEGFEEEGPVELELSKVKRL